MTDTAVDAAPDPKWRFRRHLNLISAVRELWPARGLVWTLAERDLRARYKQAVLGLLWAILTPLALLAVFTLVFGRVAKIDTGGAPPTLFFYLGLLPWTFFSSAVSAGGVSVISNKAILNKVYCPREVFPLGSVALAAVDTALASLTLIVLFVVKGFAPRGTSPWILVVIPVQVAFTVGVTLLVAGALVYLRDLRQALPIILQLGLFATPVGYRFDRITPGLRPLYTIVNPLGPVIDNYRRVMLLGKPPAWPLLGLAAVSSLAYLLGGFALFKRLEAGFADVA